MPKIVTFIGWHDSGKTTLVSQVVRHLKETGYQVAVIKSSEETSIAFDTPGTDSYKHRQAGADSVLFVAPDQMVMMTENRQEPLTTLAHRYFADVDIVIGEGFKTASGVAKIEVARDPKQKLRESEKGVIAVATDLPIEYDCLFDINDSRVIADFIKNHFLADAAPRGPKKTMLWVNGCSVPLKSFVQDALSKTVAGFVKSLNGTEDAREIEVKINVSS
ncbi:MAG: molybdopterin-guanine dinucleotide biosynthesis protein B [Deltaproteobacteria bacterium]|nr:molybdopterin-guanine dinucleotide biosynthesis protein B [Deltaproteobacteria bacterium]